MTNVAHVRRQAAREARQTMSPRAIAQASGQTPQTVSRLLTESRSTVTWAEGGWGAEPVLGCWPGHRDVHPPEGLVGPRRLATEEGGGWQRWLRASLAGYHAGSRSAGCASLLSGGAAGAWHVTGAGRSVTWRGHDLVPGPPSPGHLRPGHDHPCSSLGSRSTQRSWIFGA